MDGARTQYSDHINTMPRRKIRRMTVEEPRVSDEALQCEPLDAVFHPVQCKGQPLANLESADRPGLVKALKAQNKEDLEGILTACDVRPTAVACGRQPVQRPAEDLRCNWSKRVPLQGADPSPAEAAIALRTAAKAAQRLSSPLRIMQARRACFSAIALWQASLSEQGLSAGTRSTCSQSYRGAVVAP